MIKVVISGSCCPLKDMKYVKDASNLKIIPFRKLQLLTDNEIRSFKEESKSADLVIVALFGSPIAKVKKLGLEQIGGKKVLWTFDSHHGYVEEQLYQHYFDAYFIVHSLFCNKFDRVKAEWLPACFVRFGIDYCKELCTRSLLDSDKKYDIVFPAKSYSLGDRIAVVANIRKCFDKLKLKYHIGPVGVGDPYMNMIEQSRVVLNVSLLDDLNIRNFEAWILNRPILTNKVTDHTKLTNVDLSRTYFFQRDLSNFERMLQEALAVKNQVDTAKSILNNHMLIHRYIKIINRMLGTHAVVLPEKR